MRKIIFAILSVYVFFLIEFFLFNLAGRWFLPNLLLLMIIYFNFAFGIRYSIFAAILAGILKDSFSTEIFGFNIFAFVLCAYLTTVLKRYLHYIASRRSRLLLVFCVTIIHFFILLCLRVMFSRVDVLQSIHFVLVPEILTMLIITSFIFNQLRKCVLRLFA
jgi:rod shape-determining protein MreD